MCLQRLSYPLGECRRLSCLKAKPTVSPEAGVNFLRLKLVLDINLPDPCVSSQWWRALFDNQSQVSQGLRTCCSVSPVWCSRSQRSWSMVITSAPGFSCCLPNLHRPCRYLYQPFWFLQSNSLRSKIQSTWQVTFRSDLCCSSVLSLVLVPPFSILPSRGGSTYLWNSILDRNNAFYSSSSLVGWNWRHYTSTGLRSPKRIVLRKPIDNYTKFY